MSHPKDRWYRFLISKHKGEIRATGMTSAFSNKQEIDFEKWANRRRDTTKLCSCSMCGNPRRVEWKAKAKLTMQELKLEDINTLLFENMGVNGFRYVE